MAAAKLITTKKLRNNLANSAFRTRSEMFKWNQKNPIQAAMRKGALAVPSAVAARLTRNPVGRGRAIRR